MIQLQSVEKKMDNNNLRHVDVPFFKSSIFNLQRYLKFFQLLISFSGSKNNSKTEILSK